MSHISGIYLASLLMASLSLLTTGVVLVFFVVQYRSEPSSASRLLWIVMMIMLCDGCISICVLFWHFMQFHEPDSATINDMCKAFLPFPIFFFLAGYGWTIMVAWRFQQVSERKKLYEPAFFIVWAVAFVFILPIIALNISGNEYEVSRAIKTHSTGGSHTYCVFDSRTTSGIWTNIICFQLPLLITIAVNVQAFTKGLRALQHSPQSVLAREMNRTGKYLAVLLIVWVPNFMANLVQILSSGLASDDDNDDENIEENVGYFVETMVLMSSMQGFLNALVYAYGHKNFNKFVKQYIKGYERSYAPLLDEDDGNNGDSSPESLQKKAHHSNARIDSKDWSDEQVGRLSTSERSVRFTFENTD